ncbi:hypothetical protein [Amycolatopsis sp. CA-126428]|uniref:hypothetical protein n=1 Tax=Amycolatopsis sp. CA-126428 TaxID=2073158 RepID=UPI0018EC1AF1|nr:hypothetical protein [Amycolatopsis sp. CA-126428]
MTDHQHASEAVRKSSGVVPVLFSASAETHDDAVVALEHDTTWRSPFTSEGLRPASGE